MTKEKHNQCNMIAFWIDAPNRVSYLGNINGKVIHSHVRELTNHILMRQTERFQGRGHDYFKCKFLWYVLDHFQASSYICIASLSSPFTTFAKCIFHFNITMHRQLSGRCRPAEHPPKRIGGAIGQSCKVFRDR